MSTPRRNYPPLAMASLVMLALLAVLPSALDLPQSNPPETLEYAPVPPEDETLDDPPPGNLSSLGLGTSGSFGAGSGGGVQIAFLLDSTERRYHDLAKPLDPNDRSYGSSVVSALQAWQRYFNDRFQTYGRLVHYGSG